MIPYTVCFNSFVTFDEDVTQKVIEIIEFWKKFLKDSVNAFYDMWLPGFFHKNLVLGTNTELDVIKSKMFVCKNLSFGVFPFKLLSFVNKLSYRYQIGLKWKVFWSSFWDSLSWNAHLMFQIDLWTVNQLLFKIFVETPIFVIPDVIPDVIRRCPDGYGLFRAAIFIKCFLVVCISHVKKEIGYPFLNVA